MAGFDFVKKLLGDSPGRDQPSPELVKALNRLDKSRETVRVEVENTGIRFLSVLTLRKGLVVMGKPATLQDIIKTGGFLRIQLPWDELREIRLEVAKPHINIANGNAVIVCRSPNELLTNIKRKGVRYRTSHYNNITLVLPAMNADFRVMDISRSGVKVYARDHMDLLQVGRPIQAVIRLGRFQVALQSLVPCSPQRAMIGCEIKVADEGRAAMDKLFDYLEKAETNRTRTQRAI
ncbi:MAG: hypothetical protein OEW12_10160 [Deltaproteobacteria bacterium]|nr:hypothetical protein [Deltaproteobacteria bacterium]